MISTSTLTEMLLFIFQPSSSNLAQQTLVGNPSLSPQPGLGLWLGTRDRTGSCCVEGTSSMDARYGLRLGGKMLKETSKGIFIALTYLNST